MILFKNNISYFPLITNAILNQILIQRIWKIWIKKMQFKVISNGKKLNSYRLSPKDLGNSRLVPLIFKPHVPLRERRSHRLPTESPIYLWLCLTRSLKLYMRGWTKCPNLGPSGTLCVTFRMATRLPILLGIICRKGTGVLCRCIITWKAAVNRARWKTGYCWIRSCCRR